MTTSPLRFLSRRIAGLAIRIMPPARQDWAKAMMHEVEAIDHEPAALFFAMDCVRGALFAASRLHAARIIRNLMRAAPSRGSGVTDMDPRPAPRDPMAGILCAICAVGLGVAYLIMADAPLRLTIVNIAALLLGSGLCLWLARSRLMQEGRINTIAPVLGALLIGVAVFGTRAEGAARWVDVAGLIVQPGLLVIPLMLVLHARRGNAWTAAGLALAIAATALQPDRALAGVLFGAMALLAALKRERRDFWLALAAAAGFAITVVRPDNGSVAPFVDRILYTAFEVHPLAGACVALGALLLVLPAALQLLRGGDQSTALVFGAVWTLIVLAALLGNYPTPLVGYGGSAIVGYLLSLAALKPIVSGARVRENSAATPPVGRDPDAGPGFIVAG